jgi:hypothetical protein
MMAVIMASTMTMIAMIMPAVIIVGAGVSMFPALLARRLAGSDSIGSHSDAP